MAFSAMLHIMGIWSRDGCVSVYIDDSKQEKRLPDFMLCTSGRLRAVSLHRYRMKTVKFS